MAGGHEHIWAKTGLYIDRQLWAPCREPECEAGLTRVGDEWLVRDGVFPLSVDGMRLTLRDDEEGGVVKIILRELHGWYLLNAIEFTPGEVILDIGAHVGVVSIYLAKKWPQTKIYAFEPMPENFAHLQANLAANQVTNVSAYPLAISGNGRILRIGGNLAENSGGASAFSAGPGKNATHTVRSITLTQIFTQLDIARCKLLKIDCEGAEYEALTASEALLDRVDYLVGEFHINGTLARLGYSPEALLDLCKQHIPTAHIHVTPCRMGE
jgi:FkbM family methyltransferase